MNNYELTVVINGKATPAKRKSTTTKLEKLIGSFNGKVSKVIDFGLKDLAYPIEKAVSGYYFTFPIQMSGLDAKNLGDKIRHEEGIIRYLLIKTDSLREAK